MSTKGSNQAIGSLELLSIERAQVQTVDFSNVIDKLGQMRTYRTTMRYL